MACCCTRDRRGGTNTDEEERQPVIESVHGSFREVREKREKTMGEKCAITVIKFYFCTAGFWLPSRRCAFFVVLLLLTSILQLIYDLFIVFHCPNTHCRFLIDTEEHKNPTRTKQNATYTLASIGGLFSYLFMIVTLYVAERKRNALRPKKTILLDVKKTHLCLLAILLSVLVSCWVSSTSMFYYIVRDEVSFTSKFVLLASGVGSQLITQLTGIVACFVFAATSLAIDRFATDLIIRIKQCQSQNINQLIVIHREFAMIVSETVGSFALWFVVHWLFYALTTIMALLVLVSHFGAEHDNVKKAYIAVFFATNLFMFVFPCGCAALITSTCNSVLSNLNNTIEDSWPAGHLFREREKLQLFITYARDSAVSFKIGRVTFTSTLAWVSLFLSSSGLFFKFF